VNGTDPYDLLMLISHATERLRAGVLLIEGEKRSEGIEELAGVVSDIDAYLGSVSKDPLLRIASIDPAAFSSRLSLVRTDIQSVVEALSGQA